MVAAFDFWKFVQFPSDGDGCWEWAGTRNWKGYGRLWAGRINGKSSRINCARWAYEFCVGDIPTGMVIDHLCRNRACVNPDHLEPVTNRENVMRGSVHTDARTKAPRSMCRNGHQRTEQNTKTWPSDNGAIRCLDCYRDGKARRAQAVGI